MNDKINLTLIRYEDFPVIQKLLAELGQHISIRHDINRDVYFIERNGQDVAYCLPEGRIPEYMTIKQYLAERRIENE